MSSFTPDFFTQNRKKLASALPGHFLVFTASSLMQSSADLSFPFRQDSSFWYLTGINEPDIILTIDADRGKSALYLPSLNDYQKEWDGEFDAVQMQATSGINKIRDKSDLNRILKKALSINQKIGYLLPPPERVEPYGFYANPARRNLTNLLCKDGPCKEGELVDVRRDVARLRQVKQPVEIEAIQKAIDCTGKSLDVIKQNLHTFKNEKDIERALSAAFYESGSDGHAFHPIIAHGKNAATIHYEKNNGNLTRGLVLLDVGAQVQGYSSDISRTWSVGGEPSKRHEEIWAACLEIQKIGISLLGPGVLLADYQKELEKEADAIFRRIGCSMAGKPFPHGFSHFLGLDTHDAGIYDEPLVENSIITVEPGIYLQDEGIGVRVEDNVLITKNGVKNLTKNIPKLL